MSNYNINKNPKLVQLMIQNEKTLEETMLPVYVGERGVLEAAF